MDGAALGGGAVVLGAGGGGGDCSARKVRAKAECWVPGAMAMAWTV